MFNSEDTAGEIIPHRVVQEREKKDPDVPSRATHAMAVQADKTDKVLGFFSHTSFVATAKEKQTRTNQPNDEATRTA